MAFYLFQSEYGVELIESTETLEGATDSFSDFESANAALETATAQVEQALEAFIQESNADIPDDDDGDGNNGGGNDGRNRNN